MVLTAVPTDFLSNTNWTFAVAPYITVPGPMIPTYVLLINFGGLHSEFCRQISELEYQMLH